MSVEDLLQAESLARQTYERWRQPAESHWWESDERLRLMMIVAADAGMHAVGREGEMLLDTLEPLEKISGEGEDQPVQLRREFLRRIIAALAREEVCVDPQA